MTGKKTGNPLHPDLIPGSDGQASEAYLAVDLAYQTLSDKQKRQAYDASLTQTPAPTYSKPSYTHEASNSYRSPNPFKSSAWENWYSEGEFTETKFQSFPTLMLSPESIDTQKLTTEQLQQIIFLYLLINVLTHSRQSSPRT